MVFRKLCSENQDQIYCSGVTTKQSPETGIQSAQYNVPSSPYTSYNVHHSFACAFGELTKIDPTASNEKQVRIFNNFIFFLKFKIENSESLLFNHKYLLVSFNI